jgi:hypothetical protein
MQIKQEAAKKATEIKNAAIAFDIYGNGSRRLGDLALTNKGLVLSNGKAKSGKDITVKWDTLIAWMSAQNAATAPKVKKASKPRAGRSNGSRITAPSKKSTKTAARTSKPAPAKPAH